jgi:hypothetical protein
MDRLLAQSLVDWITLEDPRPLILRGARQVGKTWLARDLARQSGRTLVEVNFERDPRMAGVFGQRDPRAIWSDLALALSSESEPADSLLFLDEIQAAPEVLAVLRWFAEEMPRLRILAAGSLLDFALARHDFSMPVGRISYRHLEPMSFEEYLRARGEDRLLERLAAWQPEAELSPTVHERATTLYERFSMVGGMPAVVAADVNGSRPAECRRLQTDLTATFRDDFAKYAGRMEPGILDGVLLAVTGQLGRKFVLARVGEGIKQHQATRALDLLAGARLVTVAHHTHASGIPLGGDVSPRNRKVVLLDVGLVHSLLGTPAGASFPGWKSLAPAVRGQLAGQLAGQQLRALSPGSGDEPVLHYWQRSGGRPGEIDFVVQVGHQVIPVELKSGTAGSMKSLHQFMHDKRLGLALRVDTNPPSLQSITVRTTLGDEVSYRLLNLPGHLLWRAASLIERLTPS